MSKAKEVRRCAALKALSQSSRDKCDADLGRFWSKYGIAGLILDEVLAMQTLLFEISQDDGEHAADLFNPTACAVHIRLIVR
jgi:hypothetical protein